jgi:hypothetical protein
VSTLFKAIELSEAIELAVEEYDLEKIAQLDKERQHVINRYFVERKHIDEKLTLKLKQMNDSIVSRLIELQKQTRAQQVGINQASKASKAYRNNSPN